MKSSKVLNSPEGRALKPAGLLSAYRTLRRSFGHQHWWPGDTPFEIIVGAILTQNTAWTNVEKAIANLKKAGCLNPAGMRRIPESRLAGLIRPAGYFNVKADRLKSFIRFFFANYSGRIDRMKREDPVRLREKLLAVKGIGPETADSILLYALGLPFFVIDAYTRRVFSRHRVYPADEDYDSWQRLFSDAIRSHGPFRRRELVSLFNDFHAQIVTLGKNFCRTRPRCVDCPLRTFL